MKTKFNGILTLILAFVVQISFAQERTISGTVADESGPLPQVSVLKKGTTQGVETDFNGNYSILAKAGDVLVFSFVGMSDIEKTIGTSNKVDVLMASSNLLDEVVVVGFNSKGKEVLTSGVSTVTAEELSQVSSTTNVANALQGKAAGVVVTAANGKPGNNAFIRIRGTGSVNAGQEPLYIVDGMPVGERELNLINNSDIESISVLKDAASASVYGSRASNGVVVITTKKGRKTGKAKFSFNSQVGWSEKVKDNFTMMNAEQKLRYEKEIGSGVGSQSLSKNQLDKLISQDHNWQNDLLKKGFIRSNGFSVSGGGEKSTYYTSFKSESDTGIIDGQNGFERMTGRLNLTSKATDWLDLRISTGVSHSVSNEPRDRGNVQNPFNAVYEYNPYETLYKLDANNNIVLDANGNPTYNLTHSGYSISEAIRTNPETDERLRFIANISADAKILEGLVYTPQIGLTYTTRRAESYLQPGNVLDGYVGDADAPGNKLDQGNQSFSYNLLNKLSYNTSFNEVHNIGATLFTEFFNNNFRSWRTRSKGYPTADLNTQDNSSEPLLAETTRSERSLFGIGAILDYNYDEKYIFSGSIRRDGSSMFGPNNRYGTFWAVSGAWNIEKEDFFKSKIIDNLKLRVSYGTVGNDNLPSRYGHLDRYSFGTYNGGSATFPSNVANPDLKWEEKAIFDVGVDFGMFGNRLRGVVNYFSSKTSDLLFLENLAQETGEPGNPASRYTNFGSIKSKGLEVELSGDVIKNENFKWTLGANIAFVKNTVNKLPGGADYTPAGYDLILSEGEEVYTHYLVRYAGVNKENGKAMYYDKEGKATEKYSSDYAVALEGKTVSPDFDGNFSTLFDYKGISLSANFYFKYGNYIYNNIMAGNLSDGNNNQSNHMLEAFNYWKKPGDTNVLPDARLGNRSASQTSDRFLQDGSYIRLRSLKLGYEIPKKWLENSFFTSIGMYVQGQNLWTYAPHFNGDPEVGIGSDEDVSPTEVGFVPGAYNLYSYPTLKTYLLGIDLTF